jgi:hypothetical protein
MNGKMPNDFVRHPFIFSLSSGRALRRLMDERRVLQQKQFPSLIQFGESHKS